MGSLPSAAKRSLPQSTLPDGGPRTSPRETCRRGAVPASIEVEPRRVRLRATVLSIFKGRVDGPLLGLEIDPQAFQRLLERREIPLRDDHGGRAEALAQPGPGGRVLEQAVEQLGAG